MTPALQTQDLTVGYRRQTPLLARLNLAVEPGSVVCLLGVNGIGKSTLMRTLAGMQPSLGGSVSINGVDIARMSHHELARNVAVLLTERIGIGALPAYQVVELGRYPHLNWAGTLSSADHKVVEDAIAAVGAQHLARRDFNELSDGERQRIMIARALVQQPSVLLLDEPAAFLDISARVEMMVMLRRLAREEGVAIVLSSHDLELSLRIADTIWLIGGDGCLHLGAPEDLLVDGSIAAAFSSANIAFDASARGFRIVARPRARAAVSGTGKAADLARAVLEREGYEVTDMSDGTMLAVAVNAAGWEVQQGERRVSGKTFADLARFVRQQRDHCQPEPPEP